MRSHLRQFPQAAYLVTLGVLLTISLIGYLCAENVSAPDFAAEGVTIQRLPPVAPSLGEPTVYPPYGSPEAAESISPEKVSEPDRPPTLRDSGGREKDIQAEEDEAISLHTSSDFFGLITLDEELAWVNEVRPDSLLVRTARYLSQYVEEWDGSVQLGLDGTSGSSETFNVAFGVDGKRKLDVATFQFDIDYKRNSSEGEITADRLFFTCRYEYPYGTGRWNFFVEDEVTYDEFQPWNAQVALSSGVAHYLWKDEVSQLQALFGGGFSQDIGGLDDECVPEVHFGFKGKHQISKRQKLIGSCDYYPDASDFNNSRVISKASWEVLLDEEVNLSMKFSILDRLYCPNPGGKENDLDYSVLLMWQF